MAYYRLNNLAWVVNTNNCTVRPVAFNKDKTKIRVIGSDKIITLTSANPYDAVCKKFGGSTVYDNYYFFHNHQNLLPFKVRSILPNIPRYICASALEPTRRGIIKEYLNELKSEEEIINIAKKLELELLKEKVKKINKNCSCIKKSLKAKGLKQKNLCETIDF